MWWTPPGRAIPSTLACSTPTDPGLIAERGNTLHECLRCALHHRPGAGVGLSRGTTGLIGFHTHPLLVEEIIARHPSWSERLLCDLPPIPGTQQLKLSRIRQAITAAGQQANLGAELWPVDARTCWRRSAPLKRSTSLSLSTPAIGIRLTSSLSWKTTEDSNCIEEASPLDIPLRLL